MNNYMVMGLALGVGSALSWLLMEWRWRAIDAEKARLEQEKHQK